MNIIASIELGSRHIMGTDWPVENLVERDGPRRWIVHHGACNGSSTRTEVFHTRREALAAAGV